MRYHFQLETHSHLQDLEEYLVDLQARVSSSDVMGVRALNRKNI